jgi:hypothetical protein
LSSCGEIGRAAADLLHEIEAGVRVLLPSAREAHVADDGDDRLLVALEVRHRLLVRRREEHLRPRSHAHDAVQIVEPLGDERLRLLHQLGVEDAEERRVPTHRVLDDDDRAHAGLHVVRDVQAVLDELDDGDHDSRVARPAEDVIDRGAIERAELADVRLGAHEQHDRHVREVRLHAATERVRVGVGDAHHRQHEVEATLRDHLHRARARRHVRDARRVREVELRVLGEDAVGEPAVLLEDERVVLRADEEHLADAVGHQVVERGIPGPAARRGGGVRVVARHRAHSIAARAAAAHP